MKPSPATTTTSAASSSTRTAILLADVGPCGGGVRGEPPHPARRLERAVGRVVDGAAVEPVERRREVVDPLDGEPVGEQRVVLGAKLVALGVVGSEPQAADAPERVAGERLHPVERPLGELHQAPRTLRRRAASRDVVRRGCAAQCEAAVAPARAARDLARLVQAHADAALGERQRARAARDTAADDRDLRSPSKRALRRSSRASCNE